MPVYNLSDLRDMHPRLLWDEIVAATSSILEERFHGQSQALIALDFRRIPLVGSGEETLQIRLRLQGEFDLARIRRTYERPRLVELAAIAITGLSLYHLGGHEMVDVALRGSAADYLVDLPRHHLEIGGRSQRRSFEPAWRQKYRRLAAHSKRGSYLSLVEFQTPAARIEFSEPEGT
jgi:hypothetical protein